MREGDRQPRGTTSGGDGRPRNEQSQEEVLHFRLYLAGEAPNSRRALANIQDLCGQYFSDRYQLEIIDVLEDPARALEDGVLVTPTLIKVAPEPRCQFIGDLSARSMVLHALGVYEASYGTQPTPAAESAV